MHTSCTDIRCDDVTLQVAAEVAAPLSQAKKITMVSSGKGDVGVSKLTNEVFDVMSKLPHVVEGMTGVDISKVIRCSLTVIPLLSCFPVVARVKR